MHTGELATAGGMHTMESDSGMRVRMIRVEQGITDNCRNTVLKGLMKSMKFYHMRCCFRPTVNIGPRTGLTFL